MDALREQIMINNFIMAVGCARDQAKQILQKSQWQFEIALSLFLQDPSLSCLSGSSSLQQNTFPLPIQQNRHPCNTPATPPNFPEALDMFSSLNPGLGSKPTNPNSSALNISKASNPFSVKPTNSSQFNPSNIQNKLNETFQPVYTNGCTLNEAVPGIDKHTMYQNNHQNPSTVNVFFSGLNFQNNCG